MSKPVVVVTGASKGIGLAVTEILLAKFNANVLSLSRSRTAELEKLAEKHPSALRIVQCDITDESATARALADAHETYGHIDALVLNAGVAALGRIDSPTSSIDAWKETFDVNFFSLLHTVRAALPQLRASSGKVVFVSSGAAIGGMAGWGAYNASKAAMNSLCRTLANEEPEITCVAVRPGIVDTAMQQLVRSDGSNHMNAHEHTRFTEAHASGKLVMPADSGHVIAALAVNASNDVSGKFISWDAEELQAYRRS